MLQPRLKTIQKHFINYLLFAVAMSFGLESYAQNFVLDGAFARNPQKVNFATEPHRTIDFGALEWKNETQNSEFKSEQISFEQTKFRLKTGVSGVFHFQKRRLLKPDVRERLRFSTPNYTELDYKYLDNKNGLTSNRIRDIEFDNENHAWITSRGNVIELEGRLIKTIGKAQNLPDCNITDLMISSENKKVVSTFGEGFIVIADSVICHVDKKSGFISDHILKMVDINDHFYALTYDSGIVEIFDTIFLQLKLNLNLGERVSFINKKDEKLLFGTNQGRFGFIENQEVNLFSSVGIGDIQNIILSEEGIYVIDKNQRLFLFDEEGAQQLIFKENIEAVQLARSGNLWVFAELEIYLIGNNKIIRTFRNNDHFSSVEIKSAAQDNESNLWLLTKNSGLAIICPNNFYTLPSPKSLIDRNSSFCFVSSDSSIYSQHKNGGLVKIQPNGEAFGFIHSELLDIGGMVEFNNRLYIATYQGLFYIENNHLWKLEITSNRGLNSHLNISVVKDHLLISSYNFGVIIFNGQQFKVCKELAYMVNFTLAHGNQKSILASSNRGLLELNFGSSDTLLFNKPDLSIDLPSVFDLCSNKTGDIIAATSDGLWWIRNKKIDTLYAEGSNSQSFVNCEYDSASNAFWVSTSSEIFKLKMMGDSFEFEPTIGLESYSGELLNGAMIFHQSKLTFPFNGLLVQYLDHDFGFMKKAHPVNFTGLFINELPYYSNELTSVVSFEKTSDFPLFFLIEPNIESVRIDFDLTFWNAPDNLKYQYRLIGLNDQWSEPSYQNSVVFNHLPFGDYMLEIRVANQSSSLQFKPAQLHFSIGRNFYENPIFLIILLLIVTLFIYTLLRVFTSFTFDALEVYTSAGSIVQKIRILSVLTMLVLPVVSYLGSVILRLYVVNWPIIWIIEVSTFLAVSYTFIPKPNIKILKWISPINYLIVYSLFAYMGFANNLEVLVAFEISCLILFAKLIFEQTKGLVLFLIYVIFYNGFLVLTHDIASQPLGIYVAATVVCVIILAGMLLAEGSNLNKLSFANRVLESSSLYVVVCDVNGKVIYINNMVSKLFNQSESELLGQRFWRAIGLSQEEIIEKKSIIKTTLNSGKSYGYDNVLKVENKSLNFRWKDYVLDNQYLIEIGQDITTSVELEREVETLIKVATSVNNGVVILDENGLIKWCNTSFEQLTLLHSTESVGKRIDHLLDFVTTEEAEVGQSRGNQNTYIPYLGTKEVALFNRNHDLIWVLITSTLNHDSVTDADQYIEVWTDITAQKTLQEEYKFIIENASDILYSCNYKGYFTFVSESMTTQFKYPKDYLLGRHVSDVIATEHLKEVSDFYAAQFKAGIEETYFEFKIKLYTGELLWIGQNVKAIFETDGSKRIKRFQAIARDITINKHYEENLKTLSLVAQKTNNLILIMDKDLKIIWTNDAFLKFFGYSSAFVLGKNPGEFLNGPKTNMKEVDKAFKKLLSMQPVQTQVINYTKSGEEVWIQMNIDPVVEGNEIKYIAVEQDITERVQKEDIILEQTADIVQSINYSLRIQKATLPDYRHRTNIIKDSFVINQPKEVVSGDFFLVEEVRIGDDQKRVPAFVVADCTGHGIPGAMLSLLCSSMLKQAMTDPDVKTPGEALDFARTELQKFFKTKDEYNLQDGMDAAFCVVDYESMHLLYAGANLPLWILRDQKIIEVKGDKQHVGFNDSPMPFSDHVVDIKSGDQIFIFTDGFIDQFGEKSGKRFMKKGLKNLFISIETLPSDEQEKAINHAFKAWKGDNPQTDDVCIMGIKI